MTIVKPKMFSMSTPVALLDAARAYFGASLQDVRALPAQTVIPSQPDAEMLSTDQSRYARLLEKELDRQILTEVEQEDTDMLNRVRSALYED